ncbi:hypothetical protein O6H91_12G025900 [Diphasiastrum complanatum]|uniref:Uncharacterized protein n=1 Tax=Diphasiastrum complanatum TaxID=34168 RepID=A0ACC2BZR2_DIPCM|nr:hypothetical protein O6H91_12G025900 [Diphasiastrum complanatum]
MLNNIEVVNKFAKLKIIQNLKSKFINLKNMVVPIYLIWRPTFSSWIELHAMWPSYIKQSRCLCNKFILLYFNICNPRFWTIVYFSRTIISKIRILWLFNIMN